MGPFPGAENPQNSSNAFAVEASEDVPVESSATALSQPSQPSRELPPQPAKPQLSPGGAPGPQPATTRGLELIIGILLGILASLLALVGWLFCWPRIKAQSGLPATATAAPMHGQGLDGGRLGLVQFHYQGAFFNQLSWSLEGGGGTQTMVLNERSQKVARAVGRLMSTPNGEMYLSSLGGGPGGLWCILKRPAPSRRPGQLWDFKVCQANGAAYSEVRQRSETKCLVNDASSQRRMMTVIGNFTYPVFLSGERSIHVWITQADGQSLMGAQCEAKIEDPDEGSQPGSWGPAAENALPGAPSRRFYVTTTANTDASLVLAVLLGLQDVHRAARRAEGPPESSSASTGSGWRTGHGTGGTRASSGGSTAATSAAGGRESRTESAKAAPIPPPESSV